MSMSTEQVQQFVMTYLEATGSTIIEKSPCHVTVKLSPEADKALTNRPYYWGYVERTGVPAETMSFTFVFDKATYDEDLVAKEAFKHSGKLSIPGGSSNPTQMNGNSGEDNSNNSLLSRYMGALPPMPQLGPNRILREDVIYGSRRLQQIFAAAKDGGRYVNLFELPLQRQLNARTPVMYESWLGACFKVEFTCDLKREELHFLGISLRSGQIQQDFGKLLNRKQLSPQMAGNMHVQTAKLSIQEATRALEQHVLRQIQHRDYSWADQARERLAEELSVVDLYYEDLLKGQDEERQIAIREQFQARREEMQWQYEPKVVVSVMNCGLFHLR